MVTHEQKQQREYVTIYIPVPLLQLVSDYQCHMICQLSNLTPAKGNTSPRPQAITRMHADHSTHSYNQTWRDVFGFAATALQTH